MLVLSAPAHAQWSRVVFSGKGQFTDTPAPHSLRYFTANPLLRDDGDELCASCRSLSSLSVTRNSSCLLIGLVIALPMTALAQPTDTDQSHPLSYFRTKGSNTRRVGTLAGFKVLDLFRTNNEKMILFQTGVDRYRQLFDDSSAPHSPSRIVRVGKESILATRDSDGGHGGGCIEGYWWFDRAGPHPIDFESLLPKMIAHLPAGAVLFSICLDLDLEDQEVSSVVQASADVCRACGYIGTVTAHFELHGAQITSVDILYVADPQ